MTKKRDIWVVHRPDNTWGVLREGSSRPSHVTNTQREADTIARERAIRDKVDRITQGRDGRIRSHDSYGNDPRRSRDTEH